MDRIVVIANPVASQFTGGSHRDVMATLSNSHDVQAIWPSSATEATDAAALAVADGVGIVVAMGGDGMVHHVAQALVGTESTLGIIPVGTTNVVARILDLPSRPSRAARLIGSGSTPSLLGVATMHLSRGAIETEHHAVFACGFGLDAEVVIEADRDPYRKYRFGSIHYGRTALGVGLRKFPSRKPHLEVTAGDRSSHASAALLQFRDIYTYFGKIPIRLNTVVPDPMTALVLEQLKRRRIPRIAISALSGRELGNVDGIEVWDAVKSIEVVANPPVAAQADGESLGMVDAARVDWNADSLRVVSQTSI
ncbi:MAG: diacylglycerol kinase family protein [Acidimicrobiia bacterium]